VVGLGAGAIAFSAGNWALHRGGGAPPGTAPVRFSPRAWPVAVAGLRRPRRAVAV